MKNFLKSKIFLVFLALIILSTAGYWYFSSSNSDTIEKYRFTNIEKGNLESIVSSTGTISAVTTVQVGSQVSGTISKIYVDFNSKVRKGQLIAVIDTTILFANFKDAQTSLERARAQLENSNNDFGRMTTLYEKNLVSKSDYDLSKYNNSIAKTGVKSAELSLERAKTNLDYAYIKAPIDGTVISRNIDVGQTVAASFSAPTLFLIANDLSKMQILANVDESDIGQIKQGQNVRFTVQAYPNKKFRGIVDQIRLAPETIQNVVNYTVVVNFSNKDGLLLPGMTATIDFLIETADSVLKVSNAAIRLKPNLEMMAAIQKAADERMKNLPDSVQAKIKERMAQGGNRQGGMQRMFSGGNGGTRKFAQLWYLDDKGQMAFVLVKLGITDGQFTEVISDKIKAGMSVINGILIADPVTNTSTSPFQNNNQSRGSRRGF
ncbi:MAG TPA: efflux RND transporter periplasmic adaptor subunit [Ignavibacteriaceae bacterium]|nr:efflux RND transporter periplasmic adaptor subunit [Ignavibacteriaceae bacterium]